MKQDNAADTLPEEVSKNKAPHAPSLLEQIEKRGIDPGQWHTLCNLFPGAAPASVLLVVDYCQARKLDPMKKPCHIVPMLVKDAKTKAEEWRDVVMPGIYEYRITAQRTGEFLGQGPTEYGPEMDYKGLVVPEWCSVTVYRWNPKAKQRAEYTATAYFSEVVAEVWKKGERGVKVPNSRWNKAPRQMMTKCAEAAALRMGFPDEIGGEMTVEEMEGRPYSGEHGVQAVEQPPEAIEHQEDNDLDELNRSQTEALKEALSAGE